MNFPTNGHVVSTDGTITFQSLMGTVSQIKPNANDKYHLDQARCEISQMNTALYVNSPSKSQRV